MSDKLSIAERGIEWYVRMEAVSMHSWKSVISRSRADVESVRSINVSLRKMVTDRE